jgi:CheY-like chemotaxis protein
MIKPQSSDVRRKADGFLQSAQGADYEWVVGSICPYSGFDLTAVLPQSPSRALRVLSVDDNPNILELVEIMVTIAGHHITTASAGQAALDILQKEQPFDLILMDVQMPGLDGLETTRRIKRMPDAIMTPIVALTANVSADQVAACRAAGMDDHLEKPINTVKFLETLSQASQSIGQSSRQNVQRGAEKAVNAITSVYRRHMVNFAPEIERMLTLPDLAGAKAIAAYTHSIAGTAGSFGFADVSAAAFDLEAAARRCCDLGAPIEGLDPHIQRLILAVEASQAPHHGPEVVT